MKRAITHAGKALRATATWLIKALIGLVFVIGVALILAEWMSGCGESYTDSAGKVHTNKCLSKEGG